MRLGKLGNAQLERLVLSKLPRTRRESLGIPRVGEDCAFVDLDGDIAVLSMDPITSATGHIGRLSVHISCNDAAAAGAEPVGLLVTLLAPPFATEADIEAFAVELSETAREIGVDILGGHTEVTDSVTRFVTCTAIVARVSKEALLPGMRAGDDIVLTKWAGLEGSLVIAADFADRLATLHEDEKRELLSWTKHLSVVPEGRYAAKHGATAMHDVTEGGVYGAVWEMGYCAQLGVVLDRDSIPVHPLTASLCGMLELDPMRLLSSGCMLIACEDGRGMANGLSALGIDACVIGRAVQGEGLRLCTGAAIAPPEADELYRLYASS